MDRLVPGIETSACLGLVPAPHAGGGNARHAAPGANRAAEMGAAIGAVGKHPFGSVRTGAPVVDVGRRDRNLLDQGAGRIGADMRLEAMDRMRCFQATALRDWGA